MEQIWTAILPYLSAYGLKVLGAIVILIVGRFAAGLVRGLVRRLLTRSNVDPSVSSFVSSLVYIAILTVVILAALNNFGVQTTSFIAVLGAAGLAVAFALQGSLSNFAAGVLTLVLRPYRIGDFIEAAGVAGSVQEINMFSTVMSTPDNVKILVPNSKIFGDVIKNYSGNPTRRIDLVIGIGYGSSMKKARDLMQQLIESDERILKDPATVIAVAELADSSVNFVVRPWVKREDYWAVRFDLIEKIKETFDENDIEIPFPQRTVHMPGRV